ncbi:MAG: hypothetical protein CME63_00775 [Halobacteriovoraceae bacterium]|jgi:hypothetical protein|nr:hypothetical protein [Halobacteriovoraceae bacterium]MBC96259.1 hypothetical protein [Halobacteriovoraceae bacterium]|tara:strand:+ start:61591 stop:62391 length:801 start_codon:yes stop_codon:yes gene_type:complete
MLFKILTLILISITNVYSNPIVSDFDLTSYNPIKTGLKDVYCEVRLDGLTEQIKKQYVTVKIKNEIYYELYWMYPGRVALEVQGIPRGFDQLRESLKALIVNRIDYLIPQEISPKLRGYKLKEKKVGSNTVLEGEDPTNTKAINKIEVSFNNQGVLTKYKSYSPLGFQDSLFDYEKKSWSKNKWVLDEVRTKMIQGPQITETETEIEYENVVGFGMPGEITVKTKQSVVAPGENEKKIAREGESKLTFTNYKLNMGMAQKYFRAKE